MRSGPEILTQSLLTEMATLVVAPHLSPLLAEHLQDLRQMDLLEQVMAS